MPTHENTIKESMAAMMGHILEHERRSFDEALHDSAAYLVPQGMIEEDWLLCVGEYVGLSVARLRAGDIDQWKEIDSAKEALFNTLALHTAGHVYCDAVRMKAAMTDAPVAKKDYTTRIAVGVDEVLTLREDWTEEQAEEWLSANFKPARDRLVELSWEILGDLLPPEGMSFEDYKEDLAAAPDFSSVPRG